MAKLEQLQKDIEALKKAINNPNNTNPQAKASMEKTLVKLEKIAKELAESSPAGKTYKEELARQRATGEAKDEGISLYAMSKALENKPKKATQHKGFANSVTISVGDNSVDVDFIKHHSGNTYEVSKATAKKLLKSNKFNDDKWGQLFVSEDNNVNDEDPNWVFIEDLKDEDNYDVLDDGKIFLTLGTKASPKIIPDNASKKKSVPVPKADQDKYPEDDDDYCAKVIAQAKERRKKAKERANAPQKTEATKNKEKLDKVFDNVKERAEDDDITKAEILKLIDSTESLLTLLKKKLATL